MNDLGNNWFFAFILLWHLHAFIFNDDVENYKTGKWVIYKISVIYDCITVSLTQRLSNQ